MKAENRWGRSMPALEFGRKARFALGLTKTSPSMALGSMMSL